MMSYRSSVLLFIVIMILFIACNYLIWKVWNEVLVTDSQYQGGDLARMGYIYNSKHFRKNIDDLPRRHIDINDFYGRHVDMITIGDSFSNGGAGGKNRFYQDYVATHFGMEILNIPRYQDIYALTMASIFNNNGFLDWVKPRYVLIEITETSCSDLAAPVNFQQSLSEEQLKRLKVFHSQSPKVPFINNGNAKFLLYNVLYKVSDHAVFGEVYTQKLTADMFSVPNHDLLLFLRHRRLPTPDMVRSMNENLNTLADRLAVKGIRLVFMPCVEKYNLYSDFLVNRPYPASTLFEELRKLPKRYIFVDTKAILREELNKGVQDVFYADDTHWSWKASEAIAAAMKLD